MTDPCETMDGGRLIVHRDFVSLLRRHGLDTFERFYDEHTGELLRDVGPRSNLRLTLDDADGTHTFYLKRHRPMRLGERLHAWVRLRRALTPARIEWENIHRLDRLDILSMQGVAVGEDPATGRSQVMTAEIDAAWPADDYAREHFTTDADTRRTFARRLGRLVRKLHAAGLSHRDLYLCHIFVRRVEQDFELHLIDLQRVGPHLFKRRWRVKDVAQLEYSRDDAVFSRTDCVRFLHAYFDVSRLDRRHKRFTANVLGKVNRMRKRLRTKETPL